jgi:uncharacterized protein (TIGR02246 family)
MTTKTLERELLDLEKRYWRAMQEKDVDAAMRLTDDPCIITGAQGVSRVDRKTFEKLMTNAPWEIKEFEIDDEAEVRVVGDDVAIVAYKVREELTVDGKPVTLDAADASMWVKRDGGWVCALHTESPAGDPFGRDRKPAAK